MEQDKPLSSSCPLYISKDMYSKCRYIRVYCPFKVPFNWRVGRGSSLVFQGGLMGALREIQLVGCPSPKVRDVMTLRPRVSIVPYVFFLQHYGGQRSYDPS
jgi:hypothetical protein